MHNNLQGVEVQEQGEVKLSVCSQQSLYGLYRLQVAENRYFVKVFPPQKVDLYQAELSLLEKVSHPNILRPVNLGQALAARLAATFKSELLLFPEAARGNLLNYLVSNGAINEQVARFYMKQTVDGLLHAEKQAGITHPNLTLESLLMEQNRNVLICGWSNSLQMRKELSFSLAEIAISLVTGRSPFVSRDIKSDPYGKLLTAQHIGKFWEQAEKFAKKINKKIAFSNEFKEIIGLMLLGKLSNLEEVIQRYLNKNILSLEQVRKELEAKEIEVASWRSERQNKQRKIQNTEQQMIKSENKQELALNRQSSRSHACFIEEYQNALSENMNISQKSSSDKRSYFKLFDSDERIIVTHMKMELLQFIEDQKEGISIIDPLLLLQQDFCVGVEEGELRIHCSFGWNYKQMIESEVRAGVNLTAKLPLARQNGQLWGTIAEVDCPDLDPLCVGKFELWLRQSLQYYS